jgi:hypothetical protein
MLRMVKFRFCLFVAGAAALFAVSASAATNNITVPGTADVWLAGQANGTILQGIFALFDQAPGNSPVLASTGLNLTAGSTLTFSATGSTNYAPLPGCPSPTPDGAGGCGNASALSYFGISTYSGPINALIGVFINGSTPGGTAPAGVNFLTAGATSQSSYSPLLNQVFFIGDGLTGTGSGSVQQFVIPAGATRLFLGSSDGAGANYDNSGSFSVTVTDSGGGSTPPATPAPGTGVLLLTGLVALAIAYFAFMRSRTA